MVKADAYGHGLKSVGAALSGLADYFGVASDVEAGVLRSAGVSAPVLVTGALNPSGAQLLFTKNITQTVFCLDDLKLLEHFGTVFQQKIKVHIKVDTGMNRLGVDGIDEIDDIINFLNQSEYVICEGVFTHFAVSDGSDHDFLTLQHGRFESYLGRIRAKYDKPVIAHCLSSGGILTAPEYRHEMVRPGIMLYGYAPEKQISLGVKLTPAMSVSAKVVSVKRIAEGESIGYGRSCMLNEPKTVAVVRAGYGDGYKRELSGRGYVIINGRPSAILGRVCMDMFMTDVSGIDAAPGDTAEILSGGISAYELAAIADTVPHDVLTGFRSRTGITYT